MKIGILGSGYIGAPLGRLWAATGHEVMFSSRHPDRLGELVERTGSNARAGTLAEAAEFGDVILEAIPFRAISELPVEQLAGKVVLSAANYYPSRDGAIALGEQTQSQWAAARLPGAKLVKAFNMMRAAEIERRADGENLQPLAVLIASDWDDAKPIAARLVREAKFEPVDVGGLADSAIFQATAAPLYDVRISPQRAREVLASHGVALAPA